MKKKKIPLIDEEKGLMKSKTFAAYVKKNLILMMMIIMMMMMMMPKKVS